jgi:REP element-mobilizing transposase RayT
MKVEGGTYHCISRITGGRYWIEDLGKEVWCDQLRRVSQFCGVEILTYTVLDNHFHLLVFVPKPRVLAVTDLVERCRCLYPHRPKLVKEIEVVLKEGGTRADSLRSRLLARMHDLSQFLKELKQRFTMWFNAHHKLFGTIWDGRFKSILVEKESSVLRVVAAYIDLNPVRAGLTRVPESYRWSGMAAADRGDALARAGLVSVMKAQGWEDARLGYRAFVYETGMRRLKDQPHATISPEKSEEFFSGDLLKKQKWLSEGWVLGSQKFARNNLQVYLARMKVGLKRARVHETPIFQADLVAFAGRGRVDPKPIV